MLGWWISECRLLFIAAERFMFGGKGGQAAVGEYR